MSGGHWLLRPTCAPSAGSSVTGAGMVPVQKADRVLDPLYIKSLLHDAPDDALDVAAKVIAGIQRERAARL